MISTFALTATLSFAAAAEPSLADDCLSITEEGDTFPTCFDPGNGLELGVGGAGRATTTGPGVGLTPELQFGILLRTDRASRSKKGTLWFFEQRFLVARGQPVPGLQEFTVSAYEGNYRRHLREGFILVPTARPLRLPFPFDVALHARIGTFERRVYDGPGARIEVGRAALLLDPVRSSTGRFRLSVGPAMSYTIRTDGELWVHELSPFTSALVDLGAESEDGWWVARLTAIAGWSTVPGTGSFFRARGEASVERLLFAINDQPIWLALGGRGAYRDAGPYRRSEIVGSLSLVMRAFQ